MGVVNVTPDSFSDGGRYLDPGPRPSPTAWSWSPRAPACSTSAGSPPVPAPIRSAEAEELRRVVPVVERLAAESGVPVSIDTTKAAVASAALAAGARIVNDVSAGRADPDILAVTARAGAGYVAMHMLGEPRTMQDSTPATSTSSGEVGDFLVARLAVARRRRHRRRGRSRADPGHRVRQDRRAQPRAARAPAGARRARRRAGRRRHVAQVVPRPGAGRRGRRDRSATGRSARRGDARRPTSGRSTTARAWCGSTTPDPQRGRSGCST